VGSDAESARSGRLAEAPGGELVANPEEPVVDAAATTDSFELLLQRVAARAPSPADEEEQRDAAERLHALGTAEALHRLGTRPGHARARALLRDTRWDVAGAGPVPLVGQPASTAAVLSLILIRLHRMKRLAAARIVWA